MTEYSTGLSADAEPDEGITSGPDGNVWFSEFSGDRIGRITTGALSFACITNNGANTVSVIDTDTNTVVATVALGSAPWGVAVNPVASFAYVTSTGSGGNKVSVINTINNTVAATCRGVDPLGVAVNSAGTTVYVTNYNDSTVVVIKTSTNAVVATVPVGTIRMASRSIRPAPLPMW